MASRRPNATHLVSDQLSHFTFCNLSSYRRRVTVVPPQATCVACILEHGRREAAAAKPEVSRG